jgi:hypothetical protein
MSAASRETFGDCPLVRYLERTDTHGNQFSLAQSSAAGDPLLWIRADYAPPLLITTDDAHEIIAALSMWLEDVGEGA